MGIPNYFQEIAQAGGGYHSPLQTLQGLAQLSALRQQGQASQALAQQRQQQIQQTEASAARDRAYQAAVKNQLLSNKFDANQLNADFSEEKYITNTANIGKIRNAAKNTEMQTDIPSIQRAQKRGDTSAITRILGKHRAVLNAIANAHGQDSWTPEEATQYSQDHPEAFAEDLTHLNLLATGQYGKSIEPRTQEEIVKDNITQAANLAKEGETKRHDEATEDIARANQNSKLNKPLDFKDIRGLQTQIDTYSPVIKTTQDLLANDGDALKAISSDHLGRLNKYLPTFETSTIDAVDKLNSLKNAISSLTSQSFKGLGNINLKEFNTAKGIITDPHSYSEDGIYLGSKSRLHDSIETMQNILQKAVDDSHAALDKNSQRTSGNAIPQDVANIVDKYAGVGHGG